MQESPRGSRCSWHATTTPGRAGASCGQGRSPAVPGQWRSARAAATVEESIRTLVAELSGSAGPGDRVAARSSSFCGTGFRKSRRFDPRIDVSAGTVLLTSNRWTHRVESHARPGPGRNDGLRACSSSRYVGFGATQSSLCWPAQRRQSVAASRRGAELVAVAPVGDSLGGTYTDRARRSQTLAEQDRAQICWRNSRSRV